MVRMSQQARTADELLMRAYADGDVHAFETLYERHEMRLWRFIFRSVGGAATADELAQDVWLKVVRAAPAYQPGAAVLGRPPARFTTWLFTLARHRVIDHLRTQRPLQTLDESGDDGHTPVDTLAAPSGFGPLRRIETRQQAERLLGALAALPTAQREAFLLLAEGGLSLTEIATATGVGLETARSRLRYARAALRRTLEDLA